jgi:predicted metal-dependent hydrolase
MESNDGNPGAAGVVNGMPPAFAEFLRRFNAEEFWESHEVLEGPWREERSGFYKGMILFASAFVHAQRGNRHGIGAQMTKAIRELEPYRPSYLGMDVDEILASARAARAIADSNTTATLPNIDFPRLAPDPARIRGDEPELHA